MRTAVVCPDKFRGSLSAPDAAAHLAAGLRRAGIERVRECPLADGGEGTLDAMLAARGGSLRTTSVTGPLGAPVEAAWGMLPDATAVIEMARASGLAVVGGATRNDPLQATTRGTGELIAAAARAGARRIVVGVGGSATTDGGLGAITALGWKLPAGVPVVVACDVTTRFLDAATVYGPQKGATRAQVQLLTRRLQRLADEYAQRTGVEVAALEHGGAAGGLAGGLAAIGARLESGFDVVADAVGLDDAIAEADMVLTGEGRFDATSLEGKVTGSVIALAREHGIDAIAVIAGEVTDDARTALVALAEPVEPGAGGGAVPAGRPVLALSLLERAWDRDEAFGRAGQLLEEAAVEAVRAWD